MATAQAEAAANHWRCARCRTPTRKINLPRRSRIPPWKEYYSSAVRKILLHYSSAVPRNTSGVSFAAPVVVGIPRYPKPSRRRLAGATSRCLNVYRKDMAGQEGQLPVLQWNRRSRSTHNFAAYSSLSNLPRGTQVAPPHRRSDALRRRQWWRTSTRATREGALRKRLAREV